MLVDVQFRKESHQNALHVVGSEVFVGQSGNQPFSPLQRQDCFSHQHPAWSIFDRQQICLIVLESLDALLEPREVARFLWILFVANCPRSASSLAIKASMPRRFQSPFRSPLSRMFLASWSVIARPTRRAAPFKPPTGHAATDQLTSRFSAVLHKRTSCW